MFNKRVSIIFSYDLYFVIHILFGSPNKIQNIFFLQLILQNTKIFCNIQRIFRIRDDICRILKYIYYLTLCILFYIMYIT